MQKLFITDLDGTALGGGFVPYARFPDHFSSLLDTLAENGWEWAINTTWDPQGQWELVQSSKLKSRPKYLIAEYGRQLVEVQDGNLNRINPYCENNDAKVYDICKRKISKNLAEITTKFNPFRIFYYEHLTDFRLHPKEDAAAFRDFCRKFTEDPEIRTSIGERTISFRPAFLNKGMAVSYLTEQLHLRPEQVVIAGDETPDIDMMNPAFAAHYVTPSNACDAVKDHVRKHGGVIASVPFGAGIVEAVHSLAKRENWKGF